MLSQMSSQFMGSRETGKEILVLHCVTCGIVSTAAMLDLTHQGSYTCKLFGKHDL